MNRGKTFGQWKLFPNKSYNTKNLYTRYGLYLNQFEFDLDLAKFSRLELRTVELRVLYI